MQSGLTCQPCLRTSRPGACASPIERLLASGPAACHACLRDVTTRRIADSDLDFLDDLYASTRAEEVAASGWPQEAQRQFLAQQFRFQHRYYQEHHADADFLLLMRQEAPVGRLYWRSRREGATLVDISLVPPQRGRGMGSALLGLLVAHADLQGWPIDLHVEPANPARRLYERMGFAATHTQGVYLRMLRTPQTPSPGALS